MNNLQDLLQRKREIESELTEAHSQTYNLNRVRNLDNELAAVEFEIDRLTEVEDRRMR